MLYTCVSVHRYIFLAGSGRTREIKFNSCWVYICNVFFNVYFLCFVVAVVLAFITGPAVWAQTVFTASGLMHCLQQYEPPKQFFFLLSCCCWSLLYSAILRSRADSLRSHVVLHEWIAIYSAFWISTEVVYLQRWHGWCHKNLLPSRRVLCTPYNHAPCRFMQSHIRKVYACSAVTCYLHFRQNDQDLLRATAVTRGWSRYRNKSQHRKSTLEKKILPLLLQGFEPAIFQSRVQRWAIPLSGYIAMRP